MRLRKTRLLIAVLVWLALGLVSLFYGFMTALAQDLPQFEVAQLAQQSNGVIYADDGKTVLGTLRSDQYRVLVRWQEIAPVMRDAVVSIEDRRFYEHGAIDPVGMGRAAVVNIWTGTLAQGGSTITQQLVKNRWKPGQAGQRSVRRKIIESALAYQVEQHWSKQKILEEYLNTIYFGHLAYGVEAAAEVYFGVHAKDLQPHQAALLAALVQNPTALRPAAPAGCGARASQPRARQAARAGLHRLLRVPARRCQAAAPARPRARLPGARRRRSRTTSSTTCASS